MNAFLSKPLRYDTLAEAMEVAVEAAHAFNTGSTTTPVVPRAASAHDAVC